MKITLQNSQRSVRIPLRRLRCIAEGVLKHFKMNPNVRLNILFLDDQKISELQKSFLGKERPTDVLAFGMQEGKRLRGDPLLLGDIAISTETALHQAKRFRSSLERELALYVIHGILHLLGYEDRHEKGRQKMRRKERELLTLCKNGVLRKA